MTPGLADEAHSDDLPQVPADLRARAERLLQSQDLAVALLDEIQERGIVRAGVSESTVSTEIHLLAEQSFGVEKHWHKRVVRAGANTLEPYAENPPDRIIGTDDIVFIDLGPVFVDWEADVGRTYVLGEDPAKHDLLAHLEPVFHAGRAFYRESTDVTGAELYAYLQQCALDVGYEFGGPIGGHLVGEFPHVNLVGNDLLCYVHPENQTPMRSHAAAARGFFWILEIHLVDRARNIGGFYEQLLNLDPPGAE